MSGAVSDADHTPPRRIRLADGPDENAVRYPGSSDAGRKKITKVPADDPDAAWSYPITGAKTRRIARLIGVQADPVEAEFYLEAFADPSIDEVVRSARVPR